MKYIGQTIKVISLLILICIIAGLLIQMINVLKTHIILTTIAVIGIYLYLSYNSNKLINKTHK